MLVGINQKKKTKQKQLKDKQPHLLAAKQSLQQQQQQYKMKDQIHVEYKNRNTGEKKKEIIAFNSSRTQTHTHTVAHIHPKGQYRLKENKHSKSQSFQPTVDQHSNEVNVPKAFEFFVRFVSFQELFILKIRPAGRQAGFFDFGFCSHT